MTGIFFLLAASAQAQNLVKLSDSAEVEFVSPSCIRVSHGAARDRKPIASDAVTAKRVEDASAIKLQTNELEISFDRRSGLISIAISAGLNLLKETAASAKELDLEIRSSERFYGLGARPQPTLDARGLKLTPSAPLFISSRGYAFWLPAGRTGIFDIGQSASNALKITTAEQPAFEYFFAFGPSFKQIWEERNKTLPASDNPPKQDMALISMPRVPAAATPIPKSDLTGKDLLCAESNAMVHMSNSGQPLPAFDLSRYRSADDATFRRAARLGTFSPFFLDSTPDTQPGPRAEIVEQARVLRRRLSHFLLTYADEARYRGYPMLHPFLMQFPRDPEAGLSMSAYMFGDELLLSPSCDGAATREFYLPMGNWTDWNTGKIHQGKRKVTVDVPADGLIILAKNGALLPLAGVNDGDPTELHYFPRNGGEFFILEQDAADYTQAHAGPAAGIWRVEVESKVARKYEWVIHHFDRPKSVSEPEGATFREVDTQGPVQPGTWRYDATRRELHIGIQSAAQSDVIVNILTE